LLWVSLLSLSWHEERKREEDKKRKNEKEDLLTCHHEVHDPIKKEREKPIRSTTMTQKLAVTRFFATTQNPESPTFFLLRTSLFPVPRLSSKTTTQHHYLSCFIPSPNKLTNLATMSRRQRSHKPKVKPEDVNLGRFAGSSDEEGDDEQPVPEFKEQLGVDGVDADDEGMASASESEAEDFPAMKKITEGGDEGEEMEEAGSENEFTQGGNGGGEEIMDNDADSENEFEDDPASKMANAMAKILGTAAPQQSVILGKTKTPLQKMQQKEKEEEHQMKEKRQANRERNLAALHIPLSVATTNTIEDDGKLSVTQELEQERLHRRVATRGVVALFNAISQHQKGTREVRIIH
jgi:hypothetical protein